MTKSKLSYAEAMRADGKFPAVLRFAQLRPRDVAGMIAHAERRIGDLAHIDFSRAHLNEILVGADPGDPRRTTIARDVAEEAREMSEFNLTSNLLGLGRLGRKKDLAAARRRGLRSPWIENARSGPPLREGVLTLHRDWFRAADDCPTEFVLAFMDDDGEPARWDTRKCERFVNSGIAFLHEEFGGALRYARADFDEQSVHIQFVLVDRVKEPASQRYAHGRHLYRLTQHRCIGGSGDERTGYEIAQDTVAAWFDRAEYRDMHIVRGENRAAQKRAAKAEVEKLIRCAAAEALFGEADEVPAGSAPAQAVHLLKNRSAAGGKMRKDERQKAALDFLAAVGLVSPEARHQASTRRARQALIDHHAAVAGTAEEILAEPETAAARVAANANQRREKAEVAEARAIAAEKAAREEQARSETARAAAQKKLLAEREAARREAKQREAEHRERLAAAQRAAVAELAARRRELDDRAAELNRKASLINDLPRQYVDLTDSIKAAARTVGLIDHPLVQTAQRADQKMRDMVGKLGGWERER